MTDSTGFFRFGSLNQFLHNEAVVVAVAVELAHALCCDDSVVVC